MRLTRYSLWRDLHRSCCACLGLLASSCTCLSLLAPACTACLSLLASACACLCLLAPACTCLHLLAPSCACLYLLFTGSGRGTTSFLPLVENESCCFRPYSSCGWPQNTRTRHSSIFYSCYLSRPPAGGPATCLGAALAPSTCWNLV